MSFRKDYILYSKNNESANGAFSSGLNFSNTFPEIISSLFSQELKIGMHGLCFSLYEDGQNPGDIISEEQVRRRMEIIAPYTKWVRSFSCTEGNEFIPKIAKEYGIKTLVGAWLGNNPEVNEKEIEALIQLANEGFVDIAAVGNEVMYRKDLTEDELLDFIAKVKNEIPANIPVGYVDAYYEFTIKPRITEACDVILTNCYPYWEGSNIDYSLAHMKSMYYQALDAGKGKKVIITETGWPSQGESFKDSHPSKQNAMKYFINTQHWSKESNIDIFYFSSFDESWKVGAEGEVGAYWGIWDKNEKLKYNDK
ncbi:MULTISPECIES: glycosyl hydrolase family 17 protein [unclassified Flavobacterium]|uniref:glycoside hydrolase family 17 protein n=1 Tax=unclassified Flavobacterium TaxID=196869 RepID=UPI001290CE84|nr:MULTISPECIES: glycosyl hydrolase family 17 protein [unclassified Flavobacterium]MQP52631.1 glycosyl hydrolase [Flavobacterium sp. LMO9]MQP62701.1 glycosyl hydrolase [Flavobacterium sp. LMO6]